MRRHNKREFSLSSLLTALCFSWLRCSSLRKPLTPRVRFTSSLTRSTDQRRTAHARTKIGLVLVLYWSLVLVLYWPCIGLVLVSCIGLVLVLCFKFFFTFPILFFNEMIMFLFVFFFVLFVCLFVCISKIGGILKAGEIPQNTR